MQYKMVLQSVSLFLLNLRLMDTNHRYHVYDSNRFFSAYSTEQFVKSVSINRSFYLINEWNCSAINCFRLQENDAITGLTCLNALHT